MHKMVLEADPANVEAMACLAAHHFYSDQPELALRFYRRMLQMGVSTPELWNNLGLCCFYASQYDMALSCLDRALSMASDDAMADVWYNIGQVGRTTPARGTPNTPPPCAASRGARHHHEAHL